MKNHPNLIIVQSDKGAVMCVLNKDDYQKNMLDIINNASCFKKVDKDPTSTLQTKSNNYINKLQRTKAITPQVAHSLKTHNNTQNRSTFKTHSFEHFRTHHELSKIYNEHLNRDI